MKNNSNRQHALGRFVALGAVAVSALLAWTFIVHSQNEPKKQQGQSREFVLVAPGTIDAGEIKFKPDTDHDGMTDEDEANNGTNPNDPSDADADPDGDGVSNGDEVAMGLNPNAADSDGDGVSDAEEIRLGFNPLDPNSYPGATPLVSLQITPPSLDLKVNTLLGQTPGQLTVIGVKSDGTTIVLTNAPGTSYESLDASVAIVDDFGTVAGITTGSTTIRVHNGTLSADVPVTVQSFTAGIFGVVMIPGNANSVDVSGNHAYVAAGAGGLQVVTVNEQGFPRLHIYASLSLPGNANDVRIANNKAYVAAGSAGLQIVEVSNPDAPSLVGSVDTPGDAQDVMISGNRAYIADGQSGLQIVDITDPAAPVVLGSVVTPGIARGVDVSGNLVVVADDYPSSGIRIIDVTNPSNPQIVGSLPINFQAKDVAVRDRLAYVAAEGSGLVVVDFSDFAHPRAVNGIPLNGSTGFTARDVKYKGRYAAIADRQYLSQSPVIDLQDPTDPRTTGFLDFSNAGAFFGTGVAIDDKFIYTTEQAFGSSEENAANGDTWLFVGQYQAQPDSTTDTGGVAPTVSISAPQSGDSVIEGSTITISATASDDVRVAGVRFSINGADFITDTVAPYQISYVLPLDITSLTLGAMAFDLAGNTGVAAPVNLNVIQDPPPTISITSPGEGEQLHEGQNIVLSADTRDNAGVPQVVFTVNGDNLGPYERSYIIPTGVTSLNITATATDTLGQTASATRMLDVLPDALDPTISLLSPAEGAQLNEGQTITLAAEASDNVRVASVTFVANGQTLTDVGSPPYQTDYTVPAGISELIVTVTATDGVGRTVSATRTVGVIQDPGTTVTGRVVDGPGQQPVADAFVSIFDGQFTTHTAADGTFSFVGVPSFYGDVQGRVVAGGFRFGIQLPILPKAPVPGGVTDIGDVWFHAQYVTTLPEAPTTFKGLFFGFSNPHQNIYESDGLGRLVPSTNQHLSIGEVVSASYSGTGLLVQQSGNLGSLTAVTFDGNGNAVLNSSFSTGLGGEAREIQLGNYTDELAILGDDGGGGSGLRLRTFSFPNFSDPIVVPVEPGTTLRSLKLVSLNFGDKDVLALRMVSPTDTRVVVYPRTSETEFGSPTESPVIVRAGDPANHFGEFVVGRFISFQSDLAVLGNDRVRIYHGDGVGNFTPATELPLPEGMSPTGIAEGPTDFYGRTSTIIVTASETASPSNKAVMIYQVDGSGIFAAPRVFNYSAPPSVKDVRVGLGNLNKNFYFDFVVVDGDKVITIMDVIRQEFGD
jgi:hypothetical protein